MKIYLSIFFMFFGFLTFAQEIITDTIKATDLKDVVITATRTEKNIMKLPVPIIRITADDIKNRGIVRLNEILAEQTGLTIVSDHGQGIQMQGFDPQYTMIMIDGEPVIGRTSGTLELSRITMANIDKIEIVKGPTSSLYGSEAMAGVINIITVKPKDGFRASVATRYGTNNKADISLDASYKNEKISLSAFVNRNSSSGYSLIENSSSPTVVPFSGYTGNIKVGYQINKKSDLNLSVRYYNNLQKNDYVIDNRLVLGDGKESNLNINPTYNINFNAKVKSSLRLYYSRYATKSALNYQDDQTVYDDSYFTQNFSRAEFQTDYSLLNNLKLTGGIGAQYETVKATRYDQLESFNSGYGYFQADYTPLIKLNIIAGGRYDMHSVYKSQFSPKLAASYQLLNNLTFLTSVGKGYKAPDFRQLYLNFTNAVVGYSVFGYEDLAAKLLDLQNARQIQSILINPNSLQRLNAESSLSYNAGFRYAVTPKVKVSVNLFKNNIKNLISTVIIATKTNGQSVFSYLNIDRVSTQGVETDISYAPIKVFQISVGFQYLDAYNRDDVDRIKNGKVYMRDPNTNETKLVKLSDYGGLLNRSKYMANAAIAYNNAKDGVFASLRAIYRGKYGVSDLDGNGMVNMDSEYVKGYTLFNASVSKLLIKDRLRLQFSVDNVFDYKNINFISNLPGRLFYGGLTYSIK
ncbi:hypothetical protein ASE92_04005 [Pedobacter sp. Leaf41]|uniref:TonB-dependent receptor plug domain-containing protein n=1 Tax=Pedobacter sp. Leaf41 TaxID=1736218 RepID=UPI000703C272|nr:TonB-dependent receptor [Pedobacter sp. Leaf41]KQN38597.1 hypothetical protein ASE92_04005 [Pedobacter sp. Leaf41]